MGKHSTDQIEEPLTLNKSPPKSSSPAIFHKQIVGVYSIPSDHPTSPNASCIRNMSMPELGKEKRNQKVAVVIGKKESSCRILLRRFLGYGLGFKTARKGRLGSGNGNGNGNGASSRDDGIIVLRPRREINLWLRRKAASPPPLQV